MARNKMASNARKQTKGIVRRDPLAHQKTSNTRGDQISTFNTVDRREQGVDRGRMLRGLTGQSNAGPSPNGESQSGYVYPSDPTDTVDRGRMLRGLTGQSNAGPSPNGQVQPYPDAPAPVGRQDYRDTQQPYPDAPAPVGRQDYRDTQQPYPDVPGQFSVPPEDVGELPPADDVSTFKQTTPTPPGTSARPGDIPSKAPVSKDMSSTSGIDHLTSKLADAKAAVAAGPQDSTAPFLGDPRDLTPQQHQQLPNSADIVKNQGGGREARDQVGADLRAQGHQTTPNYPTGISVPETGNSALGQGQPEQPTDGRQITRNSQGVLEVRGPTGGPVDAQGRPYGPSNTPRTNKTGEEYSQTSTFQIDDDGNAVYDDDGNLIETDYGRDVKKRQDHGRNMAARRRARRAERDERLGDSYLESSPEARRQKREQRIGIKRNRALEEEYGEDRADDAIDQGLSSFNTDRRQDTEQRDAEIADTAGRGDRESAEAIATTQAGAVTDAATTQAGAITDAATTRADAVVKTAELGLDASKHSTDVGAQMQKDMQQKQIDADAAGLRSQAEINEKTAQTKFDREQETHDRDRDDAAEDRQMMVENLDEDIDIAGKTARAERGLTPENLDEEERLAKEQAGISTMDATQMARVQKDRFYGPTLNPADLPEGQEQDANTQAFIQAGDGLKQNATHTDMMNHANKMAKDASTPKQKADLGKSILAAGSMFAGSSGGEFSEDADPKQSAWLKEGQSLDQNDQGAMSEWMDRIPKVAHSQGWMSTFRRARIKRQMNRARYR